MESKSNVHFFPLTDFLLSAIPWLLLIVALYVMFIECDRVWHDLSLSYISGMIVYALTVSLPDAMRSIKLKRYVIKDLAALYREYNDLLWTISDKTSDDGSYSLVQIQKGLEQYNCRKQSNGICLSNRTIDIIKPKCEKILSLTSTLMSKQKALSVDELLIIYEITQVWFLKDVSSLEDNSDYYQGRKEMMVKAEYLVLRYNDLQSLYFKVKRKVNFTIGWHPQKKENKIVK